ncbi:MAG: PhnA protein [Bacteroidales bacterium]|nr:PhnA protein [Bacteroidales bacterium]
MNLEKDLHSRSSSQCELCASLSNLKVYEVPPTSNRGLDGSILICAHCHKQIEQSEKTDLNHWRCLNDSMWSQEVAVQVMVWRILNRLKSEDWTQNLLDMLYLDDETLKWAQATGEGDDEDSPKHQDSNGNILEAGDSVVLIKSLDVKGSSLTAKRGTVVRRISLVADNPEQIEGRVEGQQIVILTKFVKKSN